ncbi:putative pentatricopeptide repeat-containing protein At1g69350, mitochondrial [Asparagus officinalis]|nr:putative pentatricopeptide repeat-containing protein At1g69350, mitochondrial [Asparagus officinalis]
MLLHFSEINSARKLFDDMPERDVAAWNSMLSGYSRNGFVHEAVSLFRMMGSSGMEPNWLTLSILLQLCGDVNDQRLGMSVHGYCIRHFEFEDPFFENSLLVYYNKIGYFYVSEKLFERMPIRDIVSSNVMISGYIRSGCPWRALEVFQLLRKEALSLDVITLEIALQACGQIGRDAIFEGESIHGLLVRLGVPNDVYFDNSLLLMYCKCGNMESGKHLFDSMEVRNLVSWSIIVNGFVQIKCPSKAMSLFNCAVRTESEVSSELLVSALQATKITGGCAQQVMSMHCFIIKVGFDSDVYVGSSLISAYGEYGEVKFAHKCLHSSASQGNNQLACWNSILSACVHHGYFSDAVELLHSMKLQKCTFDAITLVNVLSLCTHQLDLESGKVVYGYVIRSKFDSDVFVISSLLELFIKCGLLNVACCIFSKMALRNLVTWNTMIHGCVQFGFPTASLRLFCLMQQKEGLMPDATSIAGVIEAVAQRGCEKERDYVHDYAIEKGFINDEFVANSLIVMHAKFLEFDKASLVFSRASKLKSVTWNVMIAQYSLHGLVNNAISVFHLMKLNSIAPDSITLLCLLRGFPGLGSLNCIKWLHAIILKSGHASDLYLETSLIDIYAKCGDLSMARQVFDEMSYRTIISWNSMIQSYGIHGNLEEATNLFTKVQQSGIEPTLVTFLILISASSHVGDIEKGQQFFDTMTKVYSFSPREEHFASYIDLLGRRGFVQEAYEHLEKLPSGAGVCAWGSLLGACRAQGNLDVGLAAAQKLFELDPAHRGYYALASNMFSEVGRWTDASRVKVKVDDLGVEKVRGWSRVESSFC